jgi:hypothetical protein
MDTPLYLGRINVSAHIGQTHGSATIPLNLVVQFHIYTNTSSTTRITKIVSGTRYHSIGGKGPTIPGRAFSINTMLPLTPDKKTAIRTKY